MRSGTRQLSRARAIFALLGWAFLLVASGWQEGWARDAAADPQGWASVDAEGQDGTTGGIGGRVISVATAEDLVRECRAEGKAIIQVSGTIRFAGLLLTSDKTLEGAGPGATLVGSIAISGTRESPLRNIILRNLLIRNDGGGGEDAVGIRYAHHVWIDHCDVADSPDGLIDLTHAADYVTISWTRLWYSSATQPHRFSMLIGHSDDNESEDRGKLRVTLHHNWWAQYVTERMARVRFGQVHAFNNYYSSAGNNYCLGAGFQSRLRVENNHFDGVKDPHIFYADEPTAQIVAAGNLYSGISNTTGRDAGQGASFTPPYVVQLDPGDTVKEMVMAGAGPFWSGKPTALPRALSPGKAAKALPAPDEAAGADAAFDAGGRRQVPGKHPEARRFKDKRLWIGR